MDQSLIYSSSSTQIYVTMVLSTNRRHVVLLGYLLHHRQGQARLRDGGAAVYRAGRACGIIFMRNIRIRTPRRSDILFFLFYIRIVYIILLLQSLGCLLLENCAEVVRPAVSNAPHHAMSCYPIPDEPRIFKIHG